MNNLGENDFENEGDEPVSHEEHLQYLYDIMNDSYRIIMKKGEWPVNFTKEMKLNFLTLMHEYFEIREHYEKCDRLLKMKNQIKEE